MPIDLNDPRDRAIIEDIVQKAVEASHKCHICRFQGLTEPFVSQTIAIATEIGEGDTVKGMNLMRDNHKFILSIQGKADFMVKSVMRGIGLAIASGIIAMLWLFIKAKAGGGS